MAELINLAKIPPNVLATMLLDISCALLLHFKEKPSAIAESLRAHADRLDLLERNLGGGEDVRWN